MLAWVQEVSLVLTNTLFEDFQDICSHVVTFLQTNTQLFYICKQFLLGSQGFPLTFKLSLVLISSKTNSFFFFFGGGGVILTRLKNNQPCFEVLSIVRDPPHGFPVRTATFTLQSLLSHLIRNTRQGTKSFRFSTSKKANIYTMGFHSQGMKY